LLGGGMPEGPSIVILREQVAPFCGKTVLDVGGNSRLDLQRMRRRRVREFRSWGKHFLICFAGFALRIHFMLFGSYRINERRESAPRLTMSFRNGELNFYACSLKFIDGDLDAVYDWSADVMAEEWNPRAARRKLKSQPDVLVADALLDQSIFAGVGNIIKNEVLFRIRVHPETRVGDLPPRKLGDLIREARAYSFDFYRWKKDFVLKRHWQVHAKKLCPRCGRRLAFRAALGARRRRSFFCAHCQTRYTKRRSA
jgi:endonuclease-8